VRFRLYIWSYMRTLGEHIRRYGQVKATPNNSFR